MPFQDLINKVLPRQDNRSAHITSHFGEQRGRDTHHGSDFNYQGGQTGTNLTHPTVHAPVAGVVTISGGQYGTVEIRDAAGNTHRFLHMESQSVAVGQQVTVGQEIGTMGGRGPQGATQYAQHVHYQMKDSQKQEVNPEEFWRHRTPDNPALGSTQPTAPAHGAVLHEGSHSPAVSGLQTQLRNLGYTGRNNLPLTPDSHFGPDTRRAVETFQRDHNLQVDGRAGPATLGKLRELSQQQTQTQPAHPSMLLSDAHHPGHALFKQAQASVHKLDAQQERTPDAGSDNLAASLAVASRKEGMSRIDHVLLATDASKVFAVQGELQSLHKQVAEVPTVQAIATPIAHSSQEWNQVVAQKTAEQAQQQNRQQDEQQPQQTQPAMSR